VDSRKLTNQVSIDQMKVNEKVNKVVSNVMSYADSAKTGPQNQQGKRYQKPPPSEEDRNKKRIRQAINKAEKATLLFGLDMGDVPTMNKDTLARKVTIDLHKKAKVGASGAGYKEKQVETMTDDMLTCAGLDFLGSTTQKYDNRHNKEDPNIGKFCTMPVKMIFKGKQERIQAETHLRKICKVKCSTPYPKKLRTMISELITEAKKKRPDNFILIKVNSDTLTIRAIASVNNKWEDLSLVKDIPLNILDRYEIEEADSDMEEETETHSH